ncbi:MAG: polyprenyl synthetase family protein, partial [Acidimicrobiia bacterium]|nr:polyprenyl synthetase family protein [Acidimicrobiia bacterium]
MTVDQIDRFSLVEQVLTEDRALVAEALPRFLPEREPRRWLYDLVAVYPSRRGKGLRPSLCLSAARAFGAPSVEALPSAIAIELVHNAFLVHDDIEDGSEQRRGSPTLHHQVGDSLAINVGDALAVLAMAPLRENTRVLGGRMARRIGDEFQTMMFRTIEGQAIELGWREDSVADLEPDDYLNLVLLKTCAYTTIYPLRIGSIIGSWGAVDLEAVTRFGFYLGAAFQIQDD